MREIALDGLVVNDNNAPYIIAEVGHNHSGSIEKCKQLFFAAKNAGCNSVKLQKRHNDTLYTKTFAHKPYNSFHSYGNTYLEHRKALEFSIYQYADLQAYCKGIGITFFATAFDIHSARELRDIDIPIYKVASADLLNFPLLCELIQYEKPLIISTGGHDYEDIDQCHMYLHSRGFKNFAFLHCVATYPNEDYEVNLMAIGKMRDLWKHHVIGWSDHYSGILSAISAYHYGARIIEKHFTLRRTDKGTDHAQSLEPKKMADLVNDLRICTKMRGDGEKRVYEKEKEPIRKMAKSLWPARTIYKGETFTPENIALKTPADGLSPCHYEEIIGKAAIHELSTADPLKWEDIG